MAERHAFDHLVDEKSQTLWINAYRVFFQNFEKVFFNVLKNQVQASLAENSKYSQAGTYRLKASFNVTIFLYLSMRSIRTSRMIVFFAISSSSDSLNFLIATISKGECVWFWLTEISGLLALGFVDDTVGSFANDADNLILIHNYKG